jgi:hypothetical protein
VDLYKQPNIRTKLANVQRILVETSKSLATDLNLPSTNPQSDSNRDVLEAIRDISNRLKTQETTIRQMQKHVDGDTSKLANHSPTTTSPEPPLSKQTFSQAVNSNKQPPKATAPVASPTKKSPARPKAPLRYVVRFQGDGPAPSEKLSNERAARLLNERFQQQPTTRNKLTVVGVAGKENGNYVVTFSDTSSPILAEEHKLQLLHTLAPNRTNAIVSKDVPWVKMIVHGISLKDDMYLPRTEGSLLEALTTNPIIKTVEITQPPRWILPDHRLEGKYSSSVSFAFIDKPESIVPTLLEGLYMFGSLVRLQRWENKQRPVQCRRCWKPTHHQKYCKRPQRCRKCGKLGKEEEHHLHCDECNRSPSQTGVCTHVECTNCHGHDHCANDPKCPKLAHFQKPFKNTISPNPNHLPNEMQEI